MNKKLILTIGTITSAIAPVAAVVACGSTSTSNDGKTQGTGNSNNSQTSSDGYFDDGLYRSKRPMKDYPQTTDLSISGNDAWNMHKELPLKYSLKYFEKYTNKVNWLVSPWKETNGYSATEYGSKDSITGNRKHLVYNYYEVYDYGVSHGWNYIYYSTK